MLFAISTSGLWGGNSCPGDNVANIDGATTDESQTISENDYVGGNESRYYKFTTLKNGSIVISFDDTTVSGWFSSTTYKQKMSIGTSCNGSDIHNGSSAANDSKTFNVVSGTTYYVKMQESNSANRLKYDLHFNFTASTANQPPIADANASPTNAPEGTTIHFDGTGSSDDGGADHLSYSWSESGSVLSTAPTFDKSDFAIGTHTITLTVTDADGLSGENNVTITIHANQPPHADAGADQSVLQDENVTLDGSGSTDDGGIVSYTWDANGHTHTGINPTIPGSELNIGENNITLTVKDAAGLTDTDTVIVTVMEIVENADDLCYDTIIYTGFMCFDMGFCAGGMGCKTTYPLRNISDSPLSQTRLEYDEDGLGGSFGDHCSVEPEGNCSTVHDIDMGPFGFFGSATEFNITNPIVPDNNNTSIGVTNFVSMSCFRGDNLYGTYIKDGKFHRGKILPCDANITYISGPFDAWDTFRDDNYAPPSDRNISTKIVNKPFKLSLASLNVNNDGYELKHGTGASNIEVGVYENNNSNTLISNEVTFDATTQSHVSESDEITVTQASKNAVVGFRFCATYEYNATLGKKVYFLYPNTSCSGALQNCNYETNGSPTWHICSTSDDLAVRPDKFDVNITNNTQFVAEANASIKFEALDGSGVDTQNYNEDENDTNATFSVDLNLQQPNNKCPNQTANNSPDVNFTSGVDSGDFSFDHVGRYTLKIAEKDECDKTFASIDCDDSNISGSWTVDENLRITPKEVNITIDPDHFGVVAKLHDAHESNGADFTYLASSGVSHDQINSAMASRLDLNVSAEDQNNVVTPNYTDGCYAKTLSLSISYLINGNTASASNPGELTQILYRWYDDSATPNEGTGNASLGSSFSINSISTAIFSADHNGSAKLTIQMNFDRNQIRPVNPFKLNISNVSISDGTVQDSGNISAEHNATYLYARAKPSKYFYDGVENNSTNTPISILIYQDPVSAIDMQYPMSKEFSWYLSKYHDNSNYSDGSLNLSVDSSIASITANPTITNGITTDMNVTANSITRPLIVDVNLTGSDSWLIYNKEADKEPVPFYRVRFVGSGDWSGTGKTGLVVGSTISKKKSHRVEW